MKHLRLATLATLVSILSVNAEENGKHLFILAGQSNMARLDPNVSFTPAVQAALGKENVIVVKDAVGGQPIRRWYKKWPGKPPVNTRKMGAENPPENYGELYDRLMAKVDKALAGETPATVTFVWMQGESDALDKNDGVYKESLLGLVKQLGGDMQRDDVNVVIGRLSQHRKDESWETVRKAQVDAAEASPRGAWVDTDNVEISGIHYTKAGYQDLGKRFADKAIELVQKK